MEVKTEAEKSYRKFAVHNRCWLQIEPKQDALSPYHTASPQQTVREVKLVPSKWLYSKKRGPEGRAGNQEILARKATLAWFFD